MQAADLYVATGERYKTPPLKPNKCVLVVDDFCTEGFSLNAARNYIQKTGARVILLSWLKMVNRDYIRVDILEEFDPYTANAFEDLPEPRYYPYNRYIVARQALATLKRQLGSYSNWDWPNYVS
jgi:hypoxanthine phosphoribosyltransferase